MPETSSGIQNFLNQEPEQINSEAPLNRNPLNRPQSEIDEISRIVNNEAWVEREIQGSQATQNDLMSQILSVDVFGKKKKENAKEESEDDKSSSDEDEASCTGCGGQT